MGLIERDVLKNNYCDVDCPLYEDEKGNCDDVVWNDEDIVTAVKWLNGMKGEL